MCFQMIANLQNFFPVLFIEKYKWTQSSSPCCSKVNYIVKQANFIKFRTFRVSPELNCKITV